MPVFLRRWWINKINESNREEAAVNRETQKLRQ